MTSEEQRIRIALACGWTLIHRNNADPVTGLLGIAPAGPRVFVVVPDFCSDLNAIHEAEKTLNGRQRAVFEFTLLHEVLKRPEPFTYDRGDIMAVIISTAAQRSEAFLRTLNLWKDT